jgi:hypothetical protein
MRRTIMSIQGPQFVNAVATAIAIAMGLVAPVTEADSNKIYQAFQDFSPDANPSPNGAWSY